MNSSGFAYSSDSDSDSDYDPRRYKYDHDLDSTDTEKRGLKRKRASGTSAQRSTGKSSKSRSSMRGFGQVKRKKRKPVKTAKKQDDEKPIASTDNGAVCPLPEEIWLLIFKKCVKAHGALPFLCRAARVCRMWRELSSNPCLWTSMDLSFGWIKSKDTTLNWLALHRLSRCENINLSGWKSLTNDAVEVFSQNCGELHSIDLSSCKKLTAAGITALVSKHPRLRKLVLSSMSPDAVSPQVLKHVVETTGSSLKSLSLSNNMLRSPIQVLNNIMDHCPNLENFDMSSCTFNTDNVYLDVERFRRSLPLLRELYLDNTIFQAKKLSGNVQAEGFQNLQSLSWIVDPRVFIGLSDEFVKRLLNETPQLKILDLRGNQNFAPSMLLECSSDSLEELHLALSSISDNGRVLSDIFRKWGHSLQVLDLSWTLPDPQELHEAFQVLAGQSGCVSPMTQLLLSGSSVLLRSVKLVLEKLKELVLIDLSSCRGLPRGIKCPHDGPHALQQLRQKIYELDQGSDSNTECT